MFSYLDIVTNDNEDKKLRVFQLLPKIFTASSIVQFC